MHDAGLVLSDLPRVRYSEFIFFERLVKCIFDRLSNEQFTKRHASILEQVIYKDMEVEELLRVLQCKYLMMKECRPLMVTILEILYNKRYSVPEVFVPKAKCIVVLGGAVEGRAALQRGMVASVTADGQLGTFSKMEPHPYQAVSASCVAHLGVIFLFGGKPSLYGETLSRSYLYSPFTDKWHRLADMHTSRKYFTVNVLPSERYILATGGDSEEERLSSCERFDVVTQEWSSSCSMATGRSSHASVVCDGLLYVTGGYTVEHTNKVCVYREQLDNWSDAPALLYSRADHSAGAIPGRVVVCGGWRKVGHEEINAMPVEMFNVDTQQWSTISQLSFGHYDAQPVFLNNYLYMVGGVRIYEGGRITILSDITKVNMVTGETTVEEGKLPIPAQETAVCVTELPLTTIYPIYSELYTSMN